MAQGTAPASGVNGTLLGRFFQAYLDELNPPATPTAPATDAPATRRPAPFPPQPLTNPPYPFTDWNYGGSSTLGASLPNQVVSPLMTALAPTSVGRALNDAGIQVYGWVNGGFNVSTNHQKRGNQPAAYFFEPNYAQLNQTALYVERVPDTVQRDHIDWGFRVTGLYGTDYRYTIARGLGDYQYLKHNNQYGWDFPMVYAELYVPWIAAGTVFRLGRYISVPDIEAQLAPNNYTYSHSLLYTVDPYTNVGLIATTQLSRNWLVQLSVTTGNDVMPWVQRDPGVQPSFTGCLRWTNDSSDDSLYGCANTVNNARWGYNNLNHYVATYYHRFNDRLHISNEAYYMYQRNVPNVNFTGGDYSATPFASLLRNQPNQAVCRVGQSCTANVFAALSYLNYRITDRDNVTLRAEYFRDQNGQRTGYRTGYVNGAIGVQHFFSPSIIVRPEVAVYHALDATPFDGGRHRSALIAGADLILRF